MVKMVSLWCCFWGSKVPSVIFHRSSMRVSLNLSGYSFILPQCGSYFFQLVNDGDILRAERQAFAALGAFRGLQPNDPPAGGPRRPETLGAELGIRFAGLF